MANNEKEGPITEFFHKQTQHLSRVVWVGFAFVCANAAGPMLVFIENMQVKAKSGGLDLFDLSKTIIFMGGLIGTTVLAFISRRVSDYEQQTKEHKQAVLEFETNHAKKSANKLETLG